MITPELAEALSSFPLYSQDAKKKDALCIAVFYLGNIRWYVLEGQPESDDFTLYGIVTGLHETEYELRETEDGYQKELARNEELVSNLTGNITNVRSTLKNKEQERVQLKGRIVALEAKKAQSDEIKAILDGQIKVVHELILSSHELDEQRFAKKFASLMSVLDSPRTATYWSNLQVLTNDLYGNILEDAIRLGRGILRESDVNFIALLCGGYSRTAAMICMRFNHVVTISNKKKKIAKKMGVPSLDEFIRPYQEEYQKILK